MLGVLPKAKTLIADRGYDSNWFRNALKERGTEPCIPPTKSRKTPLAYDKTLYRQRHKIENLFAKLKHWRRIATRYDRCAHTFFSAVCSLLQSRSISLNDSEPRGGYAGPQVNCHRCSRQQGTAAIFGCDDNIGLFVFLDIWRTRHLRQFSLK